MKDTVLSYCLLAYQHWRLDLKACAKRDTTFGNSMIDCIQRQIQILILLLLAEFLNFPYEMSESKTRKVDSNSFLDRAWERIEIES